MQLNDLQLCYFSALIHGLRIINEKAEDLNLDPREVDLDAGALINFVRVKGDQIAKIHFENAELPESSGDIDGQIIWPETVPFVGKKSLPEYDFSQGMRKLSTSELDKIEKIVLDRHKV